MHGEAIERTGKELALEGGMVHQWKKLKTLQCRQDNTIQIQYKYEDHYSGNSPMKLRDMQME